MAKFKLENMKSKLENIHLEQQPPNRPSFLTVVLLSGAAIIIIFLIAYFVLDWSNTGLVPKRHFKHPSSQLVLHLPSNIQHV